MFFGLIKKSPRMQLIDLTLDMFKHPERFTETELIKQYQEAEDYNGIIRLAAEEYARRKLEASHSAVKATKALTAQNSELAETVKVAEDLIARKGAENARLSKVNSELEKANVELQNANKGLKKELKTYKETLEEKDKKNDTSDDTKLQTRINELEAAVEAALAALTENTPISAIRNWGAGYNWDYKNWIKGELSKKDVRVAENKVFMQAAFEHLYRKINKYMKGRFFDEFDLFYKKMTGEGRPAPAGPWGYDWDKLDMLSCNSYWQAIGRIALSNFNKEDK